MTAPEIPALLAELNRLGVIPRPKPAQGPIKAVRSEKDVDW